MWHFQKKTFHQLNSPLEFFQSEQLYPSEVW
jgi:hypothetical protein